MPEGQTLLLPTFMGWPLANMLIKPLSPETGFNGLNFCFKLHMSVFILHGEVSCENLQKTLKLSKKHMCCKSFKVIAFNIHVNQKRILRDFLLAFNSNVGPISHRFEASYWTKNSNSWLTQPFSYVWHIEVMLMYLISLLCPKTWTTNWWRQLCQNLIVGKRSKL